jgi:hypothetical protein|tara:strand:+ start:214 stop:423 length:210 start_codon:yes stop_codon:yes gene_type:complete
MRKIKYSKKEKAYMKKNSPQRDIFGKEIDLTPPKNPFEKFIRNFFIVIFILIALYILYGLISYPITANK